MLINTKQIESLIKDNPAYSLAKNIDVNRQNLNNYKNDTYDIDQMTIALATKLQNYYNKNEGK